MLDLLEGGGAKKTNYLSGITTHCVVGKDPDEEEINEAKDVLEIPSVREEWVYGSVYCNAQLPLPGFSPVRSGLFSEVTMCLGNLSESDSVKVWAMISWHGGKVTKTLNTEVTHLANCSADGEAYQAALALPHVAVVTPDWLVETIQQDFLLDVKLFHPSSLVVPESRPKPSFISETNFLNKEKEKQDEKAGSGISSENKTTKDYLTIQHEIIKKHLMSLDQQEREAFLSKSISEQRQYVANHDLIVKVKNQTIQLTDKQNQLLKKETPKERSSSPQQFHKDDDIENLEEENENELDIKAYRQKIHHKEMNCETKGQIQKDEVGTSNNILGKNNVGLDDKDENQKRNLLEILSKQQKQSLVLTEEQKLRMKKMNRQQRCMYMKQLEGQIRVLKDKSNILENCSNETKKPELSKIVGGNLQNSVNEKLTPQQHSMKFDNTKKTPNRNVKAGQYVGHASHKKVSPNICLLGCSFLIVDYQKREEAENIAGWEKAIVQHGGLVAGDLTDKVTHVIAYSQESDLARQALDDGARLVTRYWLQDILEKKKLLPPWKAIHIPIKRTMTDLPIECMKITISGFEGKDRDHVKDMISMVGGTYTPYFTKENHALICKEEKGEKYKRAKEWKVPVLSSVWLIHAMFSSENEHHNLQNKNFKKFNAKEPLSIDHSLFENLLEPWKKQIKLSKVLN